MVWWNAATSKNKDENNGINLDINLVINYDKKQQNLVTHFRSQTERRQLLQRRPRQIRQTFRQGHLARSDGHVRQIRPAKHQEHVPLDRIRRRVVQRFAQRTRHNTQLLRRRQKRSHLRRCLGRRRQATALKLKLHNERKVRKERKNSKFNNR
jgi:hypothetical protein